MAGLNPRLEPRPASANWSDLFRDGRGLYTVLIIGGVALHALQTLVIAIIMPTVVADIGGATYYTWPAMLYTIGAIVGSASVGPVWHALGQRRGYVAGGVVFLIGAVGCALAPNMAVLNAARTVQGFAGGLLVGGSMALVGSLYGEGLRKRILACHQGTWMVAQLCGPLLGGGFAQIGWWRGSFWSVVPIIVLFCALAWAKIPDDGEGDAAPRAGGFPFVRLATLAAGVFAIALAGPVAEPAFRIGLIAAAVILVWLTFRIDRGAGNKLYPSDALSLTSPVGLALWILFLAGMVQISVTLFLPLLLQVVHGVSPLFISFVTIVISLGWTIGTFAVSGWAGARERLALRLGPVLTVIGLAAIAATALMPGLIVVTLGALLLGLGIGTYNVHLLSRAIANARKDEERITSSALPSIRSLGTAFGAALAGLLSTVAGLGDATDPAAVGRVITVIYGINLMPLALTVVFMTLFLRRDRR